MRPQVPPRTYGPRRAPNSMQAMLSTQNSTLSHQSTESRFSVMEALSTEAASPTPNPNNTPALNNTMTFPNNRFSACESIATFYTACENPISDMETEDATTPVANNSVSSDETPGNYHERCTSGPSTTGMIREPTTSQAIEWSASNVLNNTASSSYTQPNISTVDLGAIASTSRIISMIEEGSTYDEGENSRSNSNKAPSILLGPYSTISPRRSAETEREHTQTETDTRTDSGLYEANALRNLRQGQNEREKIIDTAIDDDNPSTDDENDAVAESIARTYSNVDSVEAPRGVKRICARLDPIKRWFRGNPLQRTCHNVQLWNWERQRAKAIRHDRTLARKIGKKEEKEVKEDQARHKRFEREREREAKDYVKEMGKSKEGGSVGCGVRKVVRDVSWGFRDYFRPIREECRKGVGSEGKRKKGESEEERIIREGDGLITIVLRTSQEVLVEERRLRYRLPANVEEVRDEL